jgi:hypothetical protein
MKQTNKLVTKKFTFISKYSKLTEENMETQSLYNGSLYIYAKFKIFFLFIINCFYIFLKN